MKRVIVVTVFVAVSLTLAACAPEASGVSPDPSASGAAPVGPAPSATSQALPPTVVSPGDLAGTTVPVVVGTALVIAVPDGSESEWRGATADATIAEFSAGGPSEGAVFRPGFVARGTGTTAATLTGADGRRIDFTVSVIAP